MIVEIHLSSGDGARVINQSRGNWMAVPPQFAA
jgi:hypothetical protein